MLKREGWNVNAKRIYRLYIEEGLIVRTQTRKQRAQRQRVALGHPARSIRDGAWISSHNASPMAAGSEY